MKLDVKGLRIVRCDFRNDLGSGMKINLQVNVNNRIQLPKEPKEDSAGTVFTKVMVGSPMQPLCLYMEQVCSFADSEPADGKILDKDSLMSLYRTICVPIAVDKLEERMNVLCKVYNIPEIRLQKREN